MLSRSHFAFLSPRFRTHPHPLPSQSAKLSTAISTDHLSLFHATAATAVSLSLRPQALSIVNPPQYKSRQSGHTLPTILLRSLTTSELRRRQADDHYAIRTATGIEQGLPTFRGSAGRLNTHSTTPVPHGCKRVDAPSPLQIKRSSRTN